MKKLTLILMLLLSVSIHTGCGSSSESEEGDTASADATEGEGGDEEGLDGEDVAAEEGGEEGAEGEAAEGGDAEGGDEVVADLGEGEADLPEEGAEGEDPGAGGEAPTDTADGGAGGEAPADTAMGEPAPEPVAEPEPVAVAEEPPPAPVMAPYLKIKDTPYKSNGRLLNTVYIARPGDTLEEVANKTGAQKKDLVSDNPILKRGVKPGDKIYFMSSRRPDDASTMMPYYEDKGIPPQIYVTKEGDNIRQFAKELLGHKDAWKEVWATNSNVESKDVVPPGIELKYWPSDSTESAGMDANTLPQEPPVASDPTQAPPPPPQDMAMNNVPPPPPPVDSMPPPPPPPPMDDPMNAPAIVDSAPPPPPPPPMGKPSMSSLDNDTTMALGVAAILLVAAAALFAVIMKRSRSKKIKLSQTQV